MVLKDVTVSKAKGVTVIELGKGDVQIAACSNKEDSYAGVTFMNDEPNTIGTKHNTAGTTTDDGKPQAMIVFTSIDSIEVLERALNNAKIFLRNINN